MAREPEDWGGEVRPPIWLPRTLRRPALPDNQPGARAARTGQAPRVKPVPLRLRFLAPAP